MVIDRTATGRPLGSMETALTLLNERWAMNLVAVLRLAPAPEPDPLTKALACVQRRHPALRARIEDHRFAYDVDSPVPLDVRVRPDGDAWMGAAEELLNERLPATTGPLAAATLLRGDDAGELVMGFHHAGVDGASVAALLDEVLAAYGSTPDGPPLTAPPAADELHSTSKLSLARHLAKQMAGEPRYRLAMRRAGAPGVDPKARTQVLTTTLDLDLGKESRRRRLTAASVIQAALLTAVHQRRYPGKALPLRTYTLADLRPYFEPAVGNEPLACYAALTSQDIAMQSGRDLWEIAAEVQQKVEASVRGDAKFTAAASAKPLMRMALATAKLRMGNTALTYTGNLAPDSTGPFEIRGVHGFVSNLPIGPELSMRAGTLDGRLILDAMALDTDMDKTEMRALLDDVAGALARL